MDEVELTEMHDIKVTRQDGVRTPASGITFLMMKSVAAEPPTETETAEVPDATPTPATKDAPEGASPETTDNSLEKSEGEVTLSREDVAKMIADAYAESVAAVAKERDEALAKVAEWEAKPIPGGPALSAPAAVRETRARDEALAKALYHERQAEMTQDRELIQYHSQKAKQLRAAANA